MELPLELAVASQLDHLSMVPAQLVAQSQGAGHLDTLVVLHQELRFQVLMGNLGELSNGYGFNSYNFRTNEYG